MSLLPSFAQTATASDTEATSSTYMQEWEIDEELNELTGNLVTGNKAVRSWIYKALKTARKRYPIYTWNYGSDLESFIGQTLTDEYLKTDVKLALEECLYINEAITGIEDYEAEASGDTLSLSFTASTIYGPVSILDYVIGNTSSRMQQIINALYASISAGTTKFFISDGQLNFRSVSTTESVAEFSLSAGDLLAELSASLDSCLTLSIDRDTGAVEATYTT